eukprot:scaffold133776_cov27-Tisochrysis_lutea.AAC.1
MRGNPQLTWYSKGHHLDHLSRASSEQGIILIILIKQGIKQGTCTSTRHRGNFTDFALLSGCSPI